MNLVNLDEHLALLAAYGEVQTRCTRLISEQREEIERLQAELTGVRLEMARQLALHRNLIEQLQRQHVTLIDGADAREHATATNSPVNHSI